jgi:hypothetical protein
MMTRWLFALLIASAITPAQAETAPVAFEAEYRVFYGNTEIGKGTRSLRYEGSQYQVTSKLQPAGLAKLFMGTIEERAQGKVVNQRLRPEHYFFDRSDRPKKRRDFQLDWEQMQVRNATGNDYALLPEAIDTLSMQAQLMTDLSAQASDPPNEIRYTTVGRKGTDTYTFTVKPGPELALAAGSFSTLHLVREKNGDRFEVWTAPELGHLPVRILHTEDDGKSFRLDLRTLPVFAQQTASN